MRRPSGPSVAVAGDPALLPARVGRAPATPERRRPTRSRPGPGLPRSGVHARHRELDATATVASYIPELAARRPGLVRDRAS